MSETLPIQTSEQIDQLLAALQAAQNEASPVAKSQQAGGGERYTFADLMDYDSVVAPLLKQHQLVLIESIASEDEVRQRTSGSGNIRYVSHVTLELRLLHSPSGQWLTTYARGQGESSTDKSTYVAITGARKYGLACLLNLVTSDDPEHNGGSGQKVAPSAAKPKPSAPQPPARKPAPPPASVPVADQGQQDTHRITIGSVEQIKSGTSARGDWFLHEIVSSEGLKFRTFSDEVAAAATACMAADALAEITANHDAKYDTFTVKTLSPVQPGDQQATAEQTNPAPAALKDARAAVVIESVEERTGKNGSVFWSVITNDGRFGTENEEHAKELEAMAGSGEQVVLYYTADARGKRIDDVVTNIPF